MEHSNKVLDRGVTPEEEEQEEEEGEEVGQELRTVNTTWEFEVEREGGGSGGGRVRKEEVIVCGANKLVCNWDIDPCPCCCQLPIGNIDPLAPSLVKFTPPSPSVTWFLEL